MPWDTKDKTERRKEFIAMLEVRKDNFTRLCRDFGISRKTGCKWRALPRRRRPRRYPAAP